jgi:D-alanyl-D-alanine carboxypeptidase/D-alanyl-D-alanine-endopeptidase (penicillin-binding protein 4)
MLGGMRLRGVVAGMVLAATPAWGQAGAPKAAGDARLGAEIRAMVAESAVMRAHWGVMVETLDGTPIFGLNEGQFFQPASNAKLFTTAAAMALLGGGTTYETKVVGRGVFTGTESLKGDVVIQGDGDANLSGRTLPYLPAKDRPKGSAGGLAPDPLRYLAEMADAVAATGLKTVTGDVVGDDTLFPWEPYPSDWSIDDMVWGYGAPVSALTIDDNQLQVTVTPAAVAGQPATLAVVPAMPYYTLEVSVATVAGKTGSVQMERAVGSKVLRIHGTIGVAEGPDVEEVAIQDPAEYAAMAFKGMLEARGIAVSGVARAEHRISTDAKGFLGESREALEFKLSADLNYHHGKGPTTSGCNDCGPSQLRVERKMAGHTSASLITDLTVTNKVSQNLHAELFLHQLGYGVSGDGSTAQGARVVRAFLTTKAGLDKDDFIFYDGSGLSGHDLVTPRATAKLLSYAAHDPATGSPQSWFADWKKSLPVGGEDGSLIPRFPKAPLKDHIFAKTGTLGEARALSGYVDCASGRTVIFSVMVDTHAPGSSADRDVMDRIVAAIAAAE